MKKPVKSLADLDTVLVPSRWWRIDFAGALLISETNPTIEVIGVVVNGARSMSAAFEVGVDQLSSKKLISSLIGIAVQKVGQLTHEATCKNAETLIGA